MTTNIHLQNSLSTYHGDIPTLQGMETYRELINFELWTLLNEGLKDS